MHHARGEGASGTEADALTRTGTLPRRGEWATRHGMRLLAILAASLPVLLLSCDGGGGSTSGGGTTSGGSTDLDGTWDITTAGDSRIGPSEMTNSGGTYTGVIVDTEENTEIFPGCRRTKERTEWRISVQGDGLSGTFTTLEESSGSGPQCVSRAPKVVTITGTRATPAAGATPLEGEWEVRIGDIDPFIVQVTGLKAQAWDKEDKARGRESAAQIVIAGGIVSVSAKDDDLQFSARKR